MIITIALFALGIFGFSLYASANTFSWTAQGGGTDTDYGHGVAVDGNGNSYVVGEFEGTATFGDFDLVSGGSDDVFVAKLDSDGDYLWAVRAGGTSNARGYGIAVSSEGSCYITGHFWGTADFGESISLTSEGGGDIFVAKLDASGNWLWADNFGFGDHDTGYGIDLDSAGNCYVTGEVYWSGKDYVFIGKWNTSGSWQWSQYGQPLSCATPDSRGISIAVSASGNSYITGRYDRDVQFGSGDNSVSLEGNGSDDIFIAKLNTSGTWQWARSAGGSARDQGLDIALDSDGNCYVTGYFASDPTDFGGTSLDPSDGQIFVAKLNASGTWQWVTQAGNSGPIGSGEGIVADNAGNCYVTGYFKGNGHFGENPVESSSNSIDVFIAKINSSGTWQWANRAGGGSDEIGKDIDVDSTGNCFVTGHFRGFNSIFGSTSFVSRGEEDVFVSKLSPAYDFPPDIPIAFQIEDEPFTITVTEGSGLNDAPSGVLPAINNNGAEYVSQWLSGSGINSFTIETTRPWGAAYFGGLWHAYERNEGSGLISFENVDFGGAKGDIPIIMGDEDPTLPVTLSSFTAVLTADLHVSIAWVAESETDHAGYNILRSEVKELATAIMINPALIEEGSVNGTQISYDYTDAEVYPQASYYYWLESLSLTGESEYFGPLMVTINAEGDEPEIPVIPTQTQLFSAFPNPFNPSTNLRYSMKDAGDVRIDVYNVKGQLMQSFERSHAQAGYYQVSWDGRDLNGSLVGTGVYFYRMTSGKYAATKKMVLAK